jgi:hypothetical protein
MADMRDSHGRWLPGSVPNPAGRPKKGETLTDALRERVDKDELADIMVALAKAGNVRAATYIYDRIDGQPRQHIEMSNELDGKWLEYLIGTESKSEAVGDPTALQEAST